MFQKIASRAWPLLVVAGLALTGQAAAAQRRVSSESRNGGRGFFAVGVQRADIDGLNRALFLWGLPTFSQDFLTLGGGGFGVRNRFLIGGEGHGLLQSSRITPFGSLRTSANAAYGLFDLGYQVWQARQLAVYPIVGIGGGAVSLRIHERATVGFDDLLRDPHRGVTVTTAGLILNAALGADLFIPMDQGRRRGFSIGLQAGYTFSPLESTWYADGADVAGGPDVGLTGFYVRATLGGGSRRD